MVFRRKPATENLSAASAKEKDDLQGKRDTVVGNFFVMEE